MGLGCPAVSSMQARSGSQCAPRGARKLCTCGHPTWCNLPACGPSGLICARPPGPSARRPGRRRPPCWRFRSAWPRRSRSTPPSGPSPTTCRPSPIPSASAGSTRKTRPCPWGGARCSAREVAPLVEQAGGRLVAALVDDADVTLENRRLRRGRACARAAGRALVLRGGRRPSSARSDLDGRRARRPFSPPARRRSVAARLRRRAGHRRPRRARRRAAVRGGRRDAGRLLADRPRRRPCGCRSCTAPDEAPMVDGEAGRSGDMGGRERAVCRRAGSRPRAGHRAHRSPDSAGSTRVRRAAGPGAAGAARRVRERGRPARRARAAPRARSGGAAEPRRDAVAARPAGVRRNRRRGDGRRADRRAAGGGRHVGAPARLRPVEPRDGTRHHGGCGRPRLRAGDGGGDGAPDRADARGQGRARRHHAAPVARACASTSSAGAATRRPISSSSSRSRWPSSCSWSRRCSAGSSTRSSAAVPGRPERTFVADVATADRAAPDPDALRRLVAAMHEVPGVAHVAIANGEPQPVPPGGIAIEALDAPADAERCRADVSAVAGEVLRRVLGVAQDRQPVHRMGTAFGAAGRRRQRDDGAAVLGPRRRRRATSAVHSIRRRAVARHRRGDRRRRRDENPPAAGGAVPAVRAGAARRDGAARGGTGAGRHDRTALDTAAGRHAPAEGLAARRRRGLAGAARAGRPAGALRDRAAAGAARRVAPRSRSRSRGSGAASPSA